MNKTISVSKLIAYLQEEEAEEVIKVMPKTAEIYKQLNLTMNDLNSELTKSSSNDERLEYLYNKIRILESHL